MRVANYKYLWYNILTKESHHKKTRAFTGAGLLRSTEGSVAYFIQRASIVFRKPWSRKLENHLQNDISVLATIERLKHIGLLHKDDLAWLRRMLHTEWARTTADAIALGTKLDDDSESIMERFSLVRRPRSAA